MGELELPVYHVVQPSESLSLNGRRSGCSAESLAVVEGAGKEIYSGVLRGGSELNRGPD